MNSTPTETEKRVLIAEACGWFQPNYSPDTIFMPDPSRDSGVREVDPFTDLNVMHEAEKALDTYDLREKFSRALYLINAQAYIEPGYEGEHDYEGYFSLLHSTAAQRAEAFGIALGLWSKPPSAPAP